MVTKKPVQNNGVPVGRYYTVLAIVACVVGILAYLAGNSAGKSKTKYEASQRDLKNQTKVYTNDLYINKQMPDSRDPKRWADSMRD